MRLWNLMRNLFRLHMLRFPVIILILEVCRDQKFFQCHFIAIKEQIDIICFYYFRNWEYLLKFLPNIPIFHVFFILSVTNYQRFFLISLIRFHYSGRVIVILRILGGNLYFSFNNSSQFKTLFVLSFAHEIVVPNGVRLIEVNIVVSLIKWLPANSIS